MIQVVATTFSTKSRLERCRATSTQLRPAQLTSPLRGNLLLPVLPISESGDSQALWPDHQLYNVYRPPTIPTIQMSTDHQLYCVYLLSTPNDSGRVVMRLDMVYAPSSINYNLYPPSYIPPSIQNNCKKSQFVTSKITVKSHKMWLVIRYKRSMLSDCIQCWSQLTAQLSSEQSLTCSSQTWHSGNSTVLDRESSDKVMEGLCMGQVLFSQL